MRGIFDGLRTVLFALLVFIPFGAHITFCIIEAGRTGSAIAMLIAGLVIPPLGWLHGLSVIFGYGWI